MRALLLAVIGLMVFTSGAHAQSAAEQRVLTREFERRVFSSIEQFDCASAGAARPDVIFTLQIAMVFRQVLATAVGQPQSPTLAPRQPDLAGLAVCDPFPLADSSALPDDVAALLPLLPTSLEYRLVGRDLVLRHIPLNVVFGALRNAVSDSSRMTHQQ